MAKIAWNVDWTQFYGCLKDEDMNEEGLRRWIRSYAGSQIGDMVFNPNGQRTSYRSDVWDYLADGYDPNNPENYKFFSKLATRAWQGEWESDIPHHLWMLEQQGLDHHAIWIDECRKCGMSPWFSMRMNDIHGVNDDSYYFHSKFWKEHPEFRCAEYRYFVDVAGFADSTDGTVKTERPADDPGFDYQEIEKAWQDRTLDYAHPEVREHMLKLVEEYVTRFDLDGLELDFLRWLSYFRPGFQEQGIPLMTDFVGKVRTLLDKQPHGHYIKLGIRVPIQIEACLSYGLDPLDWIDKGWIDQVVPMQRYDGYASTAPFEVWVRLLKGTKVTLCGGLDIGIRPTQKIYSGKTTLETTRAFCSSLLHKGADKIYLFNYIEEYSEIKETQELIREVASLDTIVGKPRRHIYGWMDLQPQGQTPSKILPLQLKKLCVQDIRMHLGKAAGEKASICIAAESDVPLKLRINGFECPAAEMVTLAHPTPPEGTYTWKYAVPEGAVHDGYNNLELTATKKETVIWIEVDLSI